MATSSDVNQQQALDRVMRLLEIPGTSGQEQLVSEAIVNELRAAGAPLESLTYDNANERTRIAGQTGNLIFRLDGQSSLPTRFLSAHMDTVPICQGSSPVCDGSIIRSSNPETGLGADNRSGCAAILSAAIEALARRGDHPPLVFAWFIQEEVGLEGARNLDTDKVGPIDLAFNFDGGTVEKLTVGATGGERIEVLVSGKPAHAGIAPEQGISAIAIASLAIGRLHSTGWHGRIQRAEGDGTSNVGVIEGGDATNVVTPQVRLRAEARSHDASMRKRIVAEINDAFQWALSEVTNVDAETGSLEFDSHVDYEAFRIPDDHPSVQEASRAVESIGRVPFCEVAGGGLDANWLYVHGIPAVTLGCGQRNIHTTDEHLIVEDYLDACRIATRLATTVGDA